METKHFSKMRWGWKRPGYYSR